MRPCIASSSISASRCRAGCIELKRGLRVDEVQFTRDYTFSTEGLLLYRQATGGRLPVSSLLIPIQAGDFTVGVLMLDNFNTPAAFTRGR